MFPKTSSGRWLAGIVGAVVVLAMVSVLATLLAGDDVEALPGGSPERAVQEYLLALQDREYSEAYALLASDLQSNCSLQDFQRSMRTPDQYTLRVRLDEVRMIETGAEVYVRITQSFSAQPFPSESTMTQRYLLEEEAGSWRLTDASWPYHGCARSFPEPTATPTPTPTATPAATPAAEA